jgi:hypothetical protein
VTLARSSHDGARGAVLVAFGALDCEGDARCFGESLVHAAVLHCGAFCGSVSGGFSNNVIRDATSTYRKNPNLPKYRNAFTLSATARPCL